MSEECLPLEPWAVVMSLMLFSRHQRRSRIYVREDKEGVREDCGYESLITFPKLYSNRFYVSKIESVWLFWGC